MKQVLLVITSLFILSACQSQGVYVDGILVKPEDCYGHGSQACVDAGYRPDIGMRPQKTIFDLNQENKK